MDNANDHSAGDADQSATTPRADTTEAAANADSPSGVEVGTAGETSPATDNRAPDEEILRLRDALARSQADLDNYRRRVTREKEELRKFATQSLVEEFIPVLDNLAIGLATAGRHPEAAPVTEGFKMIASRIRAVLEQNGLAEINPVGQAFDPNAHESVSLAPHDTIPDHHVASVLRVGYRLHERLVRPATVVLSSGPATPPAPPADAGDGPANP
ncbi:MAG: nucleotide exchange factor GrpE [Puniceicoccales bacterium]|nr:nucleotide exchange factor GrpE [Puniceicoccales bacterium]